MADPSQFQNVLTEITSSERKGFELRRQAMNLLKGLDGYDWVGIYRLEGEQLELDAYVGDETDHVKIPVGVGVCGTAVSQNKNQIIEDVRELSNYLSCSVSTRSEIVVLIRDERGAILGQIDIDGHRVGAFASEDESFLEHLAAILAKHWH